MVTVRDKITHEVKDISLAALYAELAEDTPDDLLMISLK
jgi:hypothetical protein